MRGGRGLPPRGLMRMLLVSGLVGEQAGIDTVGGVDGARKAGVGIVHAKADGADSDGDDIVFRPFLSVWCSILRSHYKTRAIHCKTTKTISSHTFWYCLRPVFLPLFFESERATPSNLGDPCAFPVTDRADFRYGNYPKGLHRTSRERWEERIRQHEKSLRWVIPIKIIVLIGVFVENDYHAGAAPEAALVSDENVCVTQTECWAQRHISHPITVLARYKSASDALGGRNNVGQGTVFTSPAPY